jgi:hypothetical protein
MAMHSGIYTTRAYLNTTLKNKEIITIFATQDKDHDL